MAKSLMLHALSLNDRILEPNRLPVAGHVWAYRKRDVSREEFVGNAMSMLSLLEIQDAEINWKDDIMAFDVDRRGKPVTVIISLKDDSLASDYFYFLGVWGCSGSIQLFGGDQFETPIWEEEGLIEPAMSYSVAVESEPLQMARIREMVGGELFVQRLYDDAFYLCGYTEAWPVPSGQFVVCPTTHGDNRSRQEISHTLYSLRNLMGLMASVMHVYDLLIEADSAGRLYQEQMKLMGELEREQIPPAEWDVLVRRNGSISFELAAEVMRYRDMENEILALKRLFEAIQSELGASEVQGVQSLAKRMLVPFQLVEDLFRDRFAVIGRAEEQTRILQPLMHSRMLAAQQVLLEKLLAQK